MTLTVYTPSLTANLDDPDTLAIAQGGYKRKIATPQSRIWFDAVEEKARFNWVAASGNETRALHLATLHTLAEAAGRSLSPYDVAYLDHARRAYLIDQAPGELAPRYAMLESLRVDELDTRVYGRGNLADLDVTWRREGLWRLTAPGAAATSLSSVATLYNHDYDTAQHHFDVGGAAGKGDAPSALSLLFSYSPLPFGETTIISVLPRPEIGFPTGKMYYFASSYSAISLDTSVVAATGETMPGGMMWTCGSDTSPSEEEYIQWQITSELALMGHYRVYAICRSTADAAYKLKIGHGQQGGLVYGEEQDSSSAGFGTQGWNVVHLGTVGIPARGYNPRIASSAYLLRLTATKAADAELSDELHVAGLFFVPIGGLVFTVNPRINFSGKLYIDGNQRRAWVTNTEDVIQLRTLETEGDYPHLLNPQVSHRIYVYTFTAAQYRLGITSAATIGYWPRTFGLAKSAWAA